MDGQEAEAALTELARLQAQLDQLRTDHGIPVADAQSLRLDHYRVPKLPSFSQVDPALWFLQAEISLRNSRITAQSSKADTVLAALDVEVIGCRSSTC
ncbi:unnamed protein product [Ceutorhynchus assimilis]|uniref:DUF7041 domain-containing protein n=1 Tax=Ceutorhynchus assimilis TaxID=467358 RepID=A0A9N9QS31_9CUCU|nr:unnamed protein product [Ceutorhynchus assimilis]